MMITLVFEKYRWFNTTFGYNSRGSYESRQGKTVNFRFTSRKADAQTIENNPSTGQNPQLHILHSARIKSMLREANVYRNINQNNSLDFMMEQGVGTGSLDFSTS